MKSFEIEVEENVSRADMVRHLMETENTYKGDIEALSAQNENYWGVRPLTVFHNRFMAEE
jgi:hypothetical protein